MDFIPVVDFFLDVSVAPTRGFVPVVPEVCVFVVPCFAAGFVVAGFVVVVFDGADFDDVNFVPEEFNVDVTFAGFSPVGVG